MISSIGLIALITLVQSHDLDLVETARIGALEGDGPDVFGRIVDLAADSQGNVYVLDAHSADVRVFSSGGAHLYTFGGSGAGPGEFNTPVMIEIRSGTVTVHDHDGRVSLFSPTGELISTYPTPFGARGAGVLKDGSVILLKDGSVTGREVRGEEVLLWTRDATLDTLEAVPSASLLFKGPFGNAALRSPLCGNVYFAVGSEDQLYLANGLSGEVRKD